MGKITINEIHKSLFDYVQAVSDDKLETRNKTIVGAINELFSNNNNNNDIEIDNLINEISNGKQLIANAIGEPLNAEDSFNEMSNDINGLLSTFKTNMMNNGVTVENNDKFKQLIDKIATMAEESGSKGIKFASGECKLYGPAITNAGSGVTGDQSFTFTTDIPINIDFEPTYVFCLGDFDFRQNVYNTTYDESVKNSILVNDVNMMSSENKKNGSTMFVNISSFDSNKITITSRLFVSYYNPVAYAAVNTIYGWYAIGVGEEESESFIPSWIEQNLSGQIITSNLIETLGSFDRYYKINNQIHFVKISTSEPNWKVLDLKTGTVSDWSTYANNRLTTTITCMDNDYLYAIEEKKAKRFDFNTKTWSNEFAINQNVKNNISYSSITFMDAICINEVIYTQYLIDRDDVYFYASNLSNGTEYNTSPYAAGNVYGGYLLRYKDKIIWPAATNGAVSMSYMNLYDPIAGTSSSLGYYVGQTDDEYYGIDIHPKNCYIDGDYLYYISHTGNQYNITFNVYIKDLTADYSDRYNMPYDQPLVENYTTKLNEAVKNGVLIKINDKVLLSYNGFYII